MMLRSPTPFRQGNLDSLCGLYAIVNAMQRCLDDNPAYDECWPDLFVVLVLALDDEPGLTGTLLDGIKRRPMLRLLDTAVQHMESEHAIQFTVDAPFREVGDLQEVLRELRTFSRHPGSAVLLRIKIDGLIRHWTVLEKVTRRHLLLRDSAGFRRLRLDECHLSREPAEKHHRCHRLRLNAMLHLRRA